MTPDEQISLLEQKNKSLSNELDKITADLFKMQEVAQDLKNRLDDKKHSEQLCGWAYDRATEAAKVSGNKYSHIDLSEHAEEILDWVSAISSPKESKI